MMKIIYSCSNKRNRKNECLISELLKNGEVYMDNKMRTTKNNKKEDNNFKKKNIKHGHEESAKTVFEHMEKKD